jgi:glycosyltransferase involved in cell wall biosynthesis/Flp pilus assembly protein TadD
MVDWPRITIVTPNYNQGEYIERCIRSVLNQNYPNIEYVIIDAESTDQSIEIIKTYEDKINYWVSEKDKGQSDAINKGLQRATGVIFNWLNADDYLEPNALFKVAQAYGKNPLASGWVGACRRVTEDGANINVIYPNHMARENIGQNWSGNQFYQPACFLNCFKVKEVGGVDPDLYCAMDLDLWLKLTKQGAFDKVEGIVANATIHSDAKTQRSRQKMHEETVLVMNRHGFYEGASNRYENAFNNRSFRITLPQKLKERLKKLKDSTNIFEFGLEHKSILVISDFLPIFDICSSADRIGKIINVLVNNKFEIIYTYSNKFNDEYKYKNRSNQNIKYIFLPLDVKKHVDLLESVRPEYIWMTNLWTVEQIRFMLILGRFIKKNMSSKLIIDTMDFHYKKYIRKHKISCDKNDLKLANDFLIYEKKLYQIADKIIVVSESEKDDIKSSLNFQTPTEVIPNIHDVKKTSTSFFQRKNFCFFGNFNVNHNVDAVKFFIGQIFPLILRTYPDIEFHIFGSYSERYSELFKSNNVKVLGHIEDLEKLLSNYRLFVCPLTYGAGMKGKIGLAASVGLPIVTTSIGAEGFEFIDGEHCFIANDPDEFAEKCKQIISDPITWTNFSIKSKLFIGENASTKIVSEKFTKVFRNTTIDNFQKRDSVNIKNYKSSVSFSICIPTFNRAKFLKTSVKSALDQNYNNYEIIIVNDGSTDETDKIAGNFNSNKIRYISKKHQGAAPTRNRCIEEAKGEYIIWLDDDDILTQGVIEKYFNVIKKEPLTNIIYGQIQYFENATGEKVHLYNPSDWGKNKQSLLRALLKGCVIPNPGTLVKKSLYDKVGMYDVEFWRAHDYEFWTRAGKHAKLKKLDEVVALYRVHDNNLSIGGFIDRSFESKIIRNMVRRYSVEEIFSDHQRDKYSTTAAEANYRIAKSLFEYNDYLNAKLFLESIPFNDMNAEMLEMRYKCEIFSGDSDRLRDTIEQQRSLQHLSEDTILKFKKFWASYDKLIKTGQKQIIQNKYSEAGITVKQIIKTFGITFDSMLLAAELMTKTGKKAEALRFLKQAVICGPHHINSIPPVCLNLLSTQERKDLYRIGERILSNQNANFNQGGIDVENYEKMYQGIQPLLNSSNTEDAVAALKNLVDSFPEFAKAHNDLGVLLYRQGEKDHALKHYEQAVQLDGSNITFKKNLADFYCVEQSRIEDALKLYVDVLAINPEDVETLLITGHICVSVQRLDDAQVFYNRVLEIEPWNTDAQQFLEKIQNQGQVQTAAKTPQEMYQEIQPLMAGNDPQAVIEALKDLLATYPDFALAHNDLGVLHYNAGDKENALIHYEKAAQLEPANITFKKNLADFWFVEQNRVEDALKLYVEVLARQPEDVETLLITGHICVSLQKFDDAKVFYKRVLEIEPWNADARQNLETLESRREAI